MDKMLAFKEWIWQPTNNTTNSTIHNIKNTMEAKKGKRTMSKSEI